ncbi:MAG: hypothetical protein L7H18_01150 [Candidatus Nealsonbacteria bacterium DGGOD1a]|jgi:hypothetical protein|nr:MAG: hypothetical protein L7H18_01150 [Candidatus Nealsonbacteria bacterium DGGOD1a]
MFLSIDPDIDIKAAFVLLIICGFFAAWLLKKTKNVFVSLAMLSVFADSIFLLYGDSMIYGVYSIEWLFSFSFFVWPVINTILVLFLVKNKLFIVWWVSFAINSVLASSFAWRIPFYWFTLFALNIWPMVDFILFAIIAAKLLHDPNKFLNLSKK